MKILITAATTAQAHKLKRLLGPNTSVIYADQADLPAFMIKENSFVRIPSADSASFAHRLLSMCLDHQVDYLYPLRKKEILALTEARQLFEEYQVKVIVPEKQVLERLFSPAAPNGDLLIRYQGKEVVSQAFTCQYPVGMPDTGVFVFDQNDELKYHIFTAD